MRFDLSDLDRLTGFADALERLFWCLMVVGFFAAILGSAGTGLFVLILGAAAFVFRAGLEDFVRSREKEPAAPAKPAAPKRPGKRPAPEPGPEFTVYRTSARRLRGERRLPR
ncbi:MAG TPA: hypothetical protein VGH14_22415 [Solirubrobacterales bacterium]|jgi:hypothetical protein